MAGVADAAANEQRPDHRFGQDTGGEIIREFAFVWTARHSCEFVRSDDKDSFPTSGGKINSHTWTSGQVPSLNPGYVGSLAAT